MKIGILGGGQLGRMFIQNALKYDDEIYTLDPTPGAPCHQISHFVNGDFHDYQTVLIFGKDKDVITIEIEAVNADALEELEKQGKTVIPRPWVIKMIQQKIHQKEFYKQHDIPSPDFQALWNSDDPLEKEPPFVQKMNQGGYDGRGVQLLHTKEDLKNLWKEPSLIEDLVDIDKELSVIVARNENGETKTFPVTEMVADPKLNLLDFNICPSDISESVKKQVEEIAEKFIKAVDSPGLFAIELLLDKQGKVWVNETAPRLHNSGHQSQEGNLNSQFEQLYRVITNRPLADTAATGFSGMLNIIGAPGHSGKPIYQGLAEVLKLPYAYVHLYGKTETRPGRKMGHVNILADNREELMKRLIAVKAMISVHAG